jgi:glutaredoxin
LEIPKVPSLTTRQTGEFISQSCKIHPSHRGKPRMTTSNPFNLNPSIITMYSAEWCPDCGRAKDFFNRHKIEYENVDIDEVPGATPFVKSLNNGKRIIPTIVLPDGELLMEPSDEELAEKFGMQTSPKSAGV